MLSSELFSLSWRTKSSVQLNIEVILLQFLRFHLSYPALSLPSCILLSIGPSALRYPCKHPPSLPFFFYSGLSEVTQTWKRLAAGAWYTSFVTLRSFIYISCFIKHHGTKFQKTNVGNTVCRDRAKVEKKEKWQRLCFEILTRLNTNNFQSLVKTFSLTSFFFSS